MKSMIKYFKIEMQGNGLMDNDRKLLLRILLPIIRGEVDLKEINKIPLRVNSFVEQGLFKTNQEAFEALAKLGSRMPYLTMRVKTKLFDESKSIAPILGYNGNSADGFLILSTSATCYEDYLLMARFLCEDYELDRLLNIKKSIQNYSVKWTEELIERLEENLRDEVD